MDVALHAIARSWICAIAVATACASIAVGETGVASTRGKHHPVASAIHEISSHAARARFGAAGSASASLVTREAAAAFEISCAAQNTNGYENEPPCCVFANDALMIA